MKIFVVFLCFVLVSPAFSRSTPDEESVVSNYTSSSKLDVYQQIANNIAQKITSPIYRFFGFETKNKTASSQPSQKRNYDNIEVFDDPEVKSTSPVEPVNNDITFARDVEELSVEALKKNEAKPEKVTLYSYLPVKSEINSVNTTINEVDSTINEVNSTADDEFDFEFDDEDEEPRDGAVYFLEWIGSLFQLAWGAFMALFKPSSGRVS